MELDEKQRQASFTEAGNERLEQLLKEKDLLKGGSLYDIESVTVVHHANQALKAHKLFQRDRDYIVKGGEVVIIDEFTGRMMQGRRYSEGLHQALEAKEHVTIQPENQTLASITFQNYFRLYKKLAGMTGTAVTEANEFLDIYRLDVLEIPTNRPVDRTDEHDEVYRTVKEKLRAIVAEIADCHRRGQPILVGTISIEKSEQLSGLLKDRKYIRELGQYLKKQADGLKPGKEDELKAQLNEVGDYLVDLAKKNSGDPIPHQVLNARYHEQEAHIIAQAGVPGTVTIATNMAGRGTDIQLGGNDRYRTRDWLKEEIEAGRMGAVHDAGDSTEALRQWVDDVLNAGDEWIDGRVREWIEATLADWTKQQSGSGREPSPKEIAKKRQAIEAERRPVAEKRAEIAREYAKIQAGRHNGHDADSLQSWSDAPLRAEAREWQQGANGEWSFGAINETLFRFMSEHCRAWADKEKAAGREPGAADLAVKRAAIVKKFNEIRAKCADIQADVAGKKQKSIDAGGLYVLGTERHESRRIDNQLRGRSGRQGDPGRSKFYLSLEDDLMRIFGSDRMDGVLQKLGLQEGEAITHPWINKALEKAQQKVEARNFDARKYVLKYDDVMNDQRKVIFEHRIDIMGRDDVGETVDRDAPARGAGAGRGVHPAQRLRRAVEHHRAQGRDRPHLRARSADRRLGRRGGHRRPGDQRAAAQGDRREGQGEGGGIRPRDHAADREDGAAANARPPLARASRHARASAPGDRLPQLRPARSAQRVQVRRLPPVRGHARQPARGRDRTAHAHPGRPGGRRSS